MYQVLVVDDEQLTCDFLEHKIPKLNPKFQVGGKAGNAFQALQCVNENKFDVVITDIRMLGMDGLTLCQKVKELDPGIFIIILSGYGEFEYAKRAIGCGVYSYLLKPIDNNELEGVLYSLELKLSDNKEEDCGQILSIADKAKKYINEHFMQPIGLGEIAEYSGVSLNYLSAVFRREEGISCMKYVTGVRMERASAFLLENRNMRLEEVAFRTGYVSVKHFLQVFKKYYGITPSQYREMHT